MLFLFTYMIFINNINLSTARYGCYGCALFHINIAQRSAIPFHIIYSIGQILSNEGY